MSGFNISGIPLSYQDDDNYTVTSIEQRFHRLVSCRCLYFRDKNSFKSISSQHIYTLNKNDIFGTLLGVGFPT